MEIAKIAASNGVPEGTVIIAEEQTSGKGRLERSWVTPKGCAILSIILYPDIKHLPSLIMVASVALLHTIKKVTGLKAAIKWPNDILLNGKKVSGILIESMINDKNVGYAVIGMGINVNFNVKDYPEIADTATTLLDEKGKSISSEHCWSKSKNYICYPEIKISFTGNGGTIWIPSGKKSLPNRERWFMKESQIMSPKTAA
jgi:BirA family biotin operon repressor/biotin-[acetyl-CoA-carboxylase] ligase